MHNEPQKAQRNVVEYETYFIRVGLLSITPESRQNFPGFLPLLYILVCYTAG